MVKFGRLANKIAKAEAKKGAIAVMQIGSTLRPEGLFYNSDLDVLAIYPKSLPAGTSRAEYKFDQKSGIEVNIIREPKHWFCAKLAAGNPFEITSIKFGRPLAGKDVFDSMVVPEPAMPTAIKWMDNAAWHLTGMMTKYPAIPDIYEFYTDAQKAARSALRAVVLVKRRKLVEADDELMQNLDPNIAEIYSDLIKRRHESEHYMDMPDVRKTKRITGSRDGETLLKTEYIVRYGAKEVLSLNIPTVNTVLKDVIRHGESYGMGVLDLRDRKLTLFLGSKTASPMRVVSVSLL